MPDANAFHELGDSWFRLDRLEDAAEAYREALRLEPDRIDPANTLGVILAGRGELAEAIAIFQRVVDRAPTFWQARQNLAQACISVGRMAEAIVHAREGLELDPRNSAMRNLLGEAYAALGRTAEAEAVYRQWHTEDPADPLARHYHAAYAGVDVPAVASSDYVRQAFDPFAVNFEATLAKLGYCAPQLVGAALATVLGEPRPQWRIADAGCGTGLCAPYLRPYARELIGVDLSPRMLEQAAAKATYDYLHEGELVEFLSQHATPFDVVVSADTLCYFGALDGVAQAARRSLTDGGWLIFTVEALGDANSDANSDAHSDASWQLQRHGRYRHQQAYVKATLARRGFRVQHTDAVVLRQESGAPVNGWLVTAGAA
jgi:predicted TPR repeat methyltransferase